MPSPAQLRIGFSGVRGSSFAWLGAHEKPPATLSPGSSGRGERIRTSGLVVPNDARAPGCATPSACSGRQM